MNRQETIKELKKIKDKVKLYRKDHAGLGWLETRLNGLINDLKDSL